jgi:hypothetical protein
MERDAFKDKKTDLPLWFSMGFDAADERETAEFASGVQKPMTLPKMLKRDLQK